MTTNFILSLVGALAWLPILYNRIMERFEKPKIKLFLHDFMNIVENEYNVILNIRLGIHTKIADAFVEKMNLTIEHSSGDKRLFTWAQILEPITQTAINETIMPTNRLLNAIGYNLPADTYTEPYISFTNPEFRNQYETLHNQIRIKRFHIVQSKSDKKQLELYDPYISMTNAYKKFYTWPSGDYTAKLCIYTSDKQMFSIKFSFSIDDTLTETLKELNLKIVLDKMKNTFIREEDEKLSYDDAALDGNLPIKISVVN